MEKKTMLAVYSDLNLAAQVVADLEQNGIKRPDIGLAVRDVTHGNGKTDGVLVTVSVPIGKLARILDVMEQHNPADFDVRDAQWRLSSEPPFDPSEDEFVSLGLVRSRTDAEA